MNVLSDSPQWQHILAALGMTIFHSFWQGPLLMALLWSLLKCIGHEKANIRFVITFITLTLLLICFVATFYFQWDSLEEKVSVVQPLNSEYSTLPDLTGQQVKLTLWDQILGKTDEIFFQLSKTAHWIALFWLVGSLCLATRLGLGLWQIRQLKSYRQALPQVWQQKGLSLQQQLGIRQRVAYGFSDRLDSPLTLGWLKPLILLPASLLMAMPAAHLECILVHELAHIRRRDYLWNLMQSLAEVVLFYHPAYWYIASVLEQERELACDAITLQVTGRPLVYAQALLQVASLQASFSRLVLSVKGRSGFAERIKRMVSPHSKKKSVQPLPFLLSFCLMAILLFAFTQQSPVEEPVEQISENAVGSKATEETDSVLFIIDNVIRDDITSYQALEDFFEKENIKKHSFSLSKEIPVHLDLQEKQYQKVVRISTSNTGKEANNIARGKILDAQTRKPLSGVEVTSLTEDNLKTYTDENGEYELSITEETQYLQHALPGYMPFILPSKATVIFDSPTLMSLKKVDFESNLHVFPNPGGDQIAVSFTLHEAASVEFEVLNQEGVFLRSFEYHFSSAGSQEITIPTDGFPAGTYLLRVKLNGKIESERIILQ